MEKRVMKNKSRIGKPWVAVLGSYKVGPLENAKFGIDAKGRWVTEFVLGDFRTKKEAEDSIK